MKSHLIISACGCRRGNGATFPPAQRSAEPGLLRPCPRAAARRRSSATAAEAAPRSRGRAAKVLLPEQGCSAHTGLQPVTPIKALRGCEFYLQFVRSLAFSAWCEVLPGGDSFHLYHPRQMPPGSREGSAKMMCTSQSPGRCREMPWEPPVTCCDLPCCPRQAKRSWQPAATLGTDSESIISTALISTYY